MGRVTVYAKLGIEISGVIDRHGSLSCVIDVGRRFQVLSMLDSFYLIWTTAPDSFLPRFRASVESICRHHPAATVTMLSNTLPPDFFAALRTAGRCSVQVERYDLAALARTSGRAQVSEAVRPTYLPWAGALRNCKLSIPTHLPTYLPTPTSPQIITIHFRAGLLV